MKKFSRLNSSKNKEQEEDIQQGFRKGRTDNEYASKQLRDKIFNFNQQT